MRLKVSTKVVPVQSDVVQHFFTTQLSGFLLFCHFSLILIRAHVAQV